MPGGLPVLHGLPVHFATAAELQERGNGLCGSYPRFAEQPYSISAARPRNDFSGDEFPLNRNPSGCVLRLIWQADVRRYHIPF